MDLNKRFGQTWIPHRIPMFFSQDFISILPKIESLAMTLSLSLFIYIEASASF